MADSDEPRDGSTDGEDAIESAAVEPGAEPSEATSAPDEPAAEPELEPAAAVDEPQIEPASETVEPELEPASETSEPELDPAPVEPALEPVEPDLASEPELEPAAEEPELEPAAEEPALEPAAEEPELEPAPAEPGLAAAAVAATSAVPVAPVEPAATATAESEPLPATPAAAQQTRPSASYDHPEPLVEKRGIEVTEVARTFGKVRAVSNATFYAAPGRVTALIGPNGSGKTTLLLMLASLLSPTSGTISINGLDPAVNTEQLRAIIGWMPDSIGVWPSLTVRRTLRTVGRMYGLSGKASRKRADELIELTKLGEFRDRPARVLSRGQKQKLSLARALVNDPDVLLLDEPASGLDPEARIELRGLLRDFASSGKTVLISSHVLAELEEIADDAVYISSGVTATTDQIRRASATGRPWRITVLEAELLNTALTDLGLAYQGTDDSQQVDVQIESDADAANVLRELVTRGVPVVSFHPAVGRLEHTFLDLNRGE